MSGTYLVTPYAEKDRVKALGARWDAGRRQWYVPEGRDLAPFATWLPADLRAQHEASAESLPAVAAPSPASVTALNLPTGKGIPLSRLLSGVSQAVAAAYREGVWTLVEVVDARLRNGHVYLEVSERDERGVVIAKSNAAIWANQAERILPAFEQATGAQVGPGIKLLVRARPVFKPQYGFSLEIDAIDADYTLGDLEARKREIRERLQREGLIDQNKALATPWDYNHVLVIAPEGAAGLGDFQAEASRLQAHGVCQFTYAYSRFQGEGAAAQIRLELHSALEQIRLNHPWVPDAVAIIRGGGAVNDLAWLNDYDLARAICEFDIPVLTGIGHERDSTVLDEVAHQRFDTPSKVIAGIERTIVQRVREAQSAFADIRRTTEQQLERTRRTVQTGYTAIESGAQRHLAQARQHSRDLKAEIQLNAHHAVRHAQDAVRQQITDVRQFAQQHLQRAQREVPVLFADIRAEARQSLRSARAETQADWQTVQQRAASDLQRSRDALAHTYGDTTALARHTVAQARQNTQALMREVTGQGPDKTLQRGFALVRDAQGQAITSSHAQAGAADTPITLEFRDGRRRTVLGQEEPNLQRDPP